MNRTATAIPRHMSGPHTPVRQEGRKYFDCFGNEVAYRKRPDTFVIVNEAKIVEQNRKLKVR